VPDRYHIHTAVTAPRFHRVGKFGNVDWREDCSRCTNCVKLRCLYDVYMHEAAYNRDPLVSVDTLNECKSCLSCVQGCTKGLLSVSVNPEFLAMGDEYWKPDILLTTWNQADNGKVPVSGAGYRGRFHGPGFDSIWTDMSEIVRPTRDGIHGREYISTSVDIGTKPMRLRFSADGSLLTPPSRLLELQLPAILDMPGWPVESEPLAAARTQSAVELKTLAVMTAAEAAALPLEHLAAVVPIVSEAEAESHGQLLDRVLMAHIADGPGAGPGTGDLAGKLLAPHGTPPHQCRPPDRVEPAGRESLPVVRRPARTRAPRRQASRPAHQGRPTRDPRPFGDRRPARRGDADSLRWHRAGGAHG
jgi:hypothetical protein